MAAVGLRITHLTRSLHLVVATHRHEASGWSDEVRRRHLHAWAEGRLEARRPALSSLWPIVLADDMLGAIDKLQSFQTNIPHAEQLLLASFSARWAASAHRWLPLADKTNAAQANAVAALTWRKRSHRRAVDAVGCVAAEASLASALLPWMLRGLPEGSYSKIVVLSRSLPTDIYLPTAY